MSGPDRVEARPRIPQRDPRDSVVPAAQIGAAAPATWDSARIAANPQKAQTRAMEGFQKAAGVAQGGANARALADAPGNARAAMNRQDIADPTVQKELRSSLLHLGNAIEDQRFDPNTSSKFREQLKALATASPDTETFKGALAHVRAAAQVLDQNQLAPGTKLAFDPERGTHLSSTGLPTIDKAHLDADLYYKTADGKLHVDSSKSSINAVTSEAQHTLKKTDPDDSQMGRQKGWREGGTVAEPRRLGINAMDASKGFNGLMDDRKLGVVKDAVGHPAERSIVLGDRAYSPNELDRIDEAAKKALPGYIEDARKAHVASGQPESTFKPPYGEFVKEKMATPEAAMKSFDIKAGKAVPAARPAAGFEMPTARQGGLMGGAATFGISTVVAARDGRITGEEAAQIGRQTAVGAGAGALTAAGERAVTPMVDRAVGRTIQTSAERVAATRLGQSAVTASTTGAVTRTVATRALGSTGVGAVVATGISAYENRDGLARGDSKAIGNVAADATVAVGSIAAATATGAAIGSVVPVAGTLVGGAIGLAVGVGVAYGAEISGARDWLAGKASKGVDWVKSWF